MIKLDITPNCYYCLDFEADVKNAEILYIRDEPLGISDTIIRCKHRESCKGVKRYNVMLNKLSLQKDREGELLVRKMVQFYLDC